MVKIIIGNVYSKIVGHLPDIVNIELDRVMSYYLADAHYIPSVKKKKWDGCVHLYKRYGQSFYTGLLSLAKTTLMNYDVEFEKIDRRERPVQNFPELEFTSPENFEDRPYQQFTIDRSLKFTRGVLDVSTGGGKTMIVTRLINEIKTYPFIFYVLTKDLMEQAYDNLSSCLNCKIGKVGDGQVDVQKITVCTVQTAIRALHQNDSRFKISDYVFDDEDKWDEKAIKNINKVDKVRKLIRFAKGVFVDECVTGDTEVITEKGKVRIDKIVENNCRYVQTYDGNKVKFKRILNWWAKGIRKTIRIKTSNGDTLICTKEHLFYTRNGWVKAKDLLLTKELFCINNPYTIANWFQIKNITIGTEQEVYDIEVQDTHCFFANNILIHNCHHTAAKTVKEVLIASENAFWRYGGSATPYREDNASLLIQAMFGGKIVNISASYLIKKDYLIPPYVFIEPIDSDKGYKSWKKIYKDSIVTNVEFNNHVASTANHLVSRGLSTLVLVQQYPQGDYLKGLIKGAEFITGRDKTEVRTKALQSLRANKLKCLIATSLADEGLDVPCLDAVLIAGGGKSSTRLNQRIGRTIRKNKSISNARDKSIVVIYDHFKTKYLKDHTKKIRGLLKKEEEFVVKESNGPDFICDEIDKVIGIKNDRETIFDV